MASACNHLSQGLADRAALGLGIPVEQHRLQVVGEVREGHDLRDPESGGAFSAGARRSRRSGRRRGSCRPGTACSPGNRFPGEAQDSRAVAALRDTKCGPSTRNYTLGTWFDSRRLHSFIETQDISLSASSAGVWPTGLRSFTRAHGCPRPWRAGPGVGLRPGRSAGASHIRLPGPAPLRRARGSSGARWLRRRGPGARST